MALFGRRDQKRIDEVLLHPSFPYQMGRLIGASELASYWMSIHEDVEIRRMGERLGNVAAWFFHDETWDEGATTLVIPPKGGRVAEGS